jgi:prepilin-type N-terminal cleavage/methylation domain-containing protein
MYYRKAFTMVELIFVIVIIGILAAIAVPKLSATRDDAIDMRDCKNTAVCVTDLLAEYTAKSTATKNQSKACTEAENSTKNTISIGVGSELITVSGAPLNCNHLNTTYKFGGTKVSI